MLLCSYCAGAPWFERVGETHRAQENVNIAKANPAVCAKMHALAVKQWGRQ
jgi:hypothetical protein